MKAPDIIHVSSEMDGYWTNLRHNDTDVRYIRADMVDALEEYISTLRSELRREIRAHD